MTSPRKVRLTVEARTDLRAILRYSRRTWGERQRDVYAARLSEAMDGLTWLPNLGRGREEAPVGLRSLPVGEHVVYYRVDSASVTIIRILHQKRDAASEIGT